MDTTEPTGDEKIVAMYDRGQTRRDDPFLARVRDVIGLDDDGRALVLADDGQTAVPADFYPDFTELCLWPTQAYFRRVVPQWFDPDGNPL